MCTLSYIPTENGFIVNSIRDEMISRASQTNATIKTESGYILTFPQEPTKGGSWIVSKSKGEVFSLINGAFGPYLPNKNASKSRGIILLELASAQDIDKYMLAVNLKGVEPFTLLHFAKEEQNQLVELIWDGEHKFVDFPDPAKPHIWFSKMLYTSSEILKKEKSFFRSLPTIVGKESAKEFHLNEFLFYIKTLPQEVNKTSFRSTSFTQIQNFNNSNTMETVSLLTKNKDKS